MSAFVVVEVEVHDKERYETYKQMAAASVAAHGGRYLVRGGAVETLEGEWSPKRLVILEFPSMDQARAWRGSQDYAEAIAVRRDAARVQMILAEGV
jgi:uncharacterized protein (DUF1330 family)